ncbi:MAG: hypothetical protein AAF851_08455 [Myxococcota bacterium]
MILWAPLLVAATGNATLVIEPQEGAVRVQENWQIRLAELGTPQLGLAEGARDVQVEGETWSFVLGRGLVPKEQLPPGPHEVVVVYEVPSRAGRARVRWNPPGLNVQGVRLAVPVIEDLEVETSRPGRSQARSVEGVTFNLTDIDRPFSAGAFVVDLDGLPTHATWPKWAALSVALVVLLAGVGLLSRPPRLADAPLDAPAARRVRLLEALRQLEAQAPDLSPAGVEQRREELLDALGATLREMKGQ